MLNIHKATLSNGLRVVTSKDTTTPMLAVNVLYNVGAKDEDPTMTGFAHLFEHLMFGGTKRIPEFDSPLQLVGGENNAWTSNDMTNYYITLPSPNIETAFWLEADRMLELDFTQKSLDTQKKVVIEEFKQRYLNQPYGDIPLLSRPLAYKSHPYQWPTIGKKVEHIQDAKLSDVKDFFYKHYAPNNAILSVVGNIEADEVFRLAEKWFGNIPMRNTQERNLPVEPKQTEMRSLEVERDVPRDFLQMSFHMCDRTSSDYHATDLLSDVLSNGESSRLNQELVKNKKIFSGVDAFVSGSVEPGLFTFAGYLSPEVSMDKAEAAIWEQIDEINSENISDYELQKVKNKVESNLVFSEISYQSKASDIAQFELLGKAEDINVETEKYRQVGLSDIYKCSKQILTPSNCSVLRYNAKK